MARKKTGGRKKGSRNKATLERAVIAEQITNRANMAQTPLAKEVLSKFMQVFAGMAAIYQPTPRGSMQQNPDANENQFERWARLAVDCAHKLVPYQSPAFRAVIVAPAPEERGERITRFTLNIFDVEDRQEPRLINGGGPQH